MTAVVPMTVRRRRCSERLSDSNRLAPCEETTQEKPLVRTRESIPESISRYHFGLEFYSPDPELHLDLVLQYSWCVCVNLILKQSDDRLKDDRK